MEGGANTAESVILSLAVRIRYGLRRIQPLVSMVHAVRRRNQIRLRDRAASEYLAKPSLRKLHLGCSNQILPGWFNADIFPVYDGAYYMDATEPFPFPGASFDLIFSEHMIEHIEYLQGLHMLKECFRVMKPGGTIRIATPDLEFIAGLYSPDSSLRQEQYKRSVIECWRKDYGSSEVGVVVNNIFNFGHQFIYDRCTLSELLERAGFKDPQVLQPAESAIPEFSGIAVHCEDYISLETLVIEASKA